MRIKLLIVSIVLMWSCISQAGTLAELSGNLLSYHDFRAGTFFDLSRNGHNGHNGTPTAVRFNREGLCGGLSSSKVINGSNYIDVSAPTVSALTILTKIKIRSYGTNARIVDNGKFILYTNHGAQRLGLTSNGFSTTTTGSTALPLGGWITVGVRRDVNGQSDFILNGSLDGINKNSGTPQPGTTDLVIMNRSGSNNSLDGCVAWIVIFNKELTQTQFNQVTAEIESYQWPTARRQHARASLEIDPNQSGLVGGWNMRPLNNQVFDVSTGGNDGAITGAVYGSTILGDSMVFDGVASVISMGDVLDVGTGNYTVSTWILPNDITLASSIISKHYAFPYYNLGIAASALSGAFSGSVETQHNLAALGLSSGVWAHVAFTVDRDSSELWLYVNGVATGPTDITDLDGFDFSSGNTLMIGSKQFNPNYFDGKIIAPEIFNRALSAAEIVRKTQRGARALQYGTAWGTPDTITNITSGQIPGSDIVVSTGAHKIITELVGGRIGKVLETVTAGIVNIPTNYFKGPSTEGAHGSYAGRYYHADASITNIGIIAQQADVSAAGYGIQVASDEVTTFEEWGVGSVIGGGVTVADAWTDFLVTVSAGGAFELWLDGASVGTGTDTTVTTSAYFVLDFDAGDKLLLEYLGGGGGFHKHMGVIQ